MECAILQGGKKNLVGKYGWICEYGVQEKIEFGDVMWIWESYIEEF